MRNKKNFEHYLKKNRRAIDNALKGHLRRCSNPKGGLSQAFKYALFPGGKRIRPILCLEAAKVCGGSVKDALPAACAIEMIHNFSLVHDDLPSMDNDDLRRGKPTCHKKFSEAIAVLAGDGLLVMAYEILAGIKYAGISKDISKVISKAIGAYGMIGGQAFDIKYAGKRKSPAMQSDIDTLKTAFLFSAALETGAISAHASAKKRKALKRFGVDFGKAFQVRDDIKDIKYGKKHLDNRKCALNRLINKAKSSLDIFGGKADNLRYAADYLRKG